MASPEILRAAHEKSPGSTLVIGELELDRCRHELRRADQRVALQEQPYQILDCLLDRSDELVIREELRDRLWPKGVYAEYEKGIHVAMMKLREAFGDSAEAPRPPVSRVPAAAESRSARGRDALQPQASPAPRDGIR